MYKKPSLPSRLPLAGGSRRRQRLSASLTLA